jgi:ankyrin repeat protein
MHLAVAKLDVKAVVKLLLRNADVNSPDLKTGDTPLHLLMNVFSKN